MIITKIIITFYTKKIHLLVHTTELFYMFGFATSDSTTDFLETFYAVEGVAVILLDHMAIVKIWLL